MNVEEPHIVIIINVGLGVRGLEGRDYVGTRCALFSNQQPGETTGSETFVKRE